MNSQIKKLLDLQKIDSEIFKLKKEKIKKPAELEKYESDIAVIRNDFMESEKELKEMELEIKNKEIDLNAKEEEIKKYQIQLYQIKTNKEYSSLQHEIESSKADNSVLEEKIISLLDKIDKKRAELKTKEQKLRKEEAVLKDKKKEVELDIKEIEQSIHKLKTNKEALTEGVEEEILEKYEKVLEYRDGYAMACIESGACSGCFMNLPPQIENDVRLGNFVACPNCSRILYIEE
jgi:hypothetical protein